MGKKSKVKLCFCQNIQKNAWVGRQPFIDIHFFSFCLVFLSIKMVQWRAMDTRLLKNEHCYSNVGNSTFCTYEVQYYKFNNSAFTECRSLNTSFQWTEVHETVPTQWKSEFIVQCTCINKRCWKMCVTMKTSELD